jgi:N-acetylmuramoyl-L-alanine amidase
MKKKTNNSPVNLSRRSALQAGSLALLLGTQHIARGATIMAVRVWPAKDYTRLTIESDNVIKAKQFFIPEPPRLAVDIEGMDLIPALRELVAKVKPDDPNIAGIRIGQNMPGVVRLVMDLKQPMLPQVFSLAPVAAYQHRLVFDLYPAQPADTLEILITEHARSQPAPLLAASAALPASAAQAALPAAAQASAAAQAAPAIPVAQAASAAKAAPVALPAIKIASPEDPLGKLIADQFSRAAQTSTPAKLAEKKVQPVSLPATRIDTPVARTSTPAAHNKTDRLIIVALDPGHGGEDPGAIGPGGTREKDVVLQIALRLRDRINQQPNMRAYLTRDADFFVPLNVRVQKARSVQADLFISLHADAFFNAVPQGASVFALSEKGASSSAARWLAAKENSADLVGGINLQSKDVQTRKLLLDLSTTAQINDSLKLGGFMLGEMGNVGKLHKGQVEQASFAVLKAPDIPSVLVETAFISNPLEETRLRSDSYQTQLANALMRGINQYFSKNPPLARNRAV